MKQILYAKSGFAGSGVEEQLSSFPVLIGYVLKCDFQTFNEIDSSIFV